MIEQSCQTCQWFCALMQLDRDAVKELGMYGVCRLKAPYHNGWPPTWASYWCGDWQERKRPPATDPTSECWLRNDEK